MPDRIVVRGAREHNLQNIDVEIPREQLVVITGLSGSGKSSLAFDTLYAEGQRRYVESLSAYARQFLEQMEKPDVDAIEGLSPAIAIEQKTASKNPRSTVATVTEIHDYLRLLFARAGRAHLSEVRAARSRRRRCSRSSTGCWRSPRRRASTSTRRSCAAGRASTAASCRSSARRASCACASTASSASSPTTSCSRKTVAHTIEVLVDRLAVRAGLEKRLADSLETAFARGDDVVLVERLADDGSVAEEMLFSRRFACVDLRHRRSPS